MNLAILSFTLISEKRKLVLIPKMDAILLHPFLAFVRNEYCSMSALNFSDMVTYVISSTYSSMKFQFMIQSYTLSIETCELQKQATEIKLTRPS